MVSKPRFHASSVFWTAVTALATVAIALIMFWDLFSPINQEGKTEDEKLSQKIEEPQKDPTFQADCDIPDPPIECLTR